MTMRGKSIGKFWTAVLGGINLLIVLAMVFAGYGGVWDPEVLALGGIAAMTFPLCLGATVILAALDLFVKPRLAWIPFGGLAATIVPILSWCPLHFGGMAGHEDREDTFTVMTYNLFDWKPADGQWPQDGSNATISAIISSGADIVVCQESYPLKPMRRLHFTARQVDSLKAIYPYEHVDDNCQGLLSRYPFTTQRIQVGDTILENAVRYDLTVNGRPLTIYNVHLHSFGLTKADKKLYGNLTRLKAREEGLLGDIRHQLLSKLKAAAIGRARQARLLRQYILDHPSENTLVCGDFNDIQDSYAIRTICRGTGLRQSYRDAGLGPAITYRKNRFWFRIDHILYGGNLSPLKVWRDDSRASDHYPLMALFSQD